jgi:RimJ/RimL family protein N-acetyltransferase
MLTYHPVTEEEKYIIADWKYTGEYALYNTESYEEDLKKHTGFAHPEFLGYSFYDNETLTGFTTLSEEETEVMLGIGVTPELCSKGYGQEMIRITCEISENCQFCTRGIESNTEEQYNTGGYRKDNK